MSEVLFSIDLKFQSDLESNNASADLRQRFEDKGLTLPDEVIILAKEPGSRWLITDTNHTPVFAVRKVGDTLNVYQQRILWIEDDHYHIRGLARPLELRGLQVVPAFSFVEARSYLENWRSFCLILLDLIIPYSQTELTNPDQTGDDTIEAAVQNGTALLRYMVNELGIDIPVLVLSVVRTETIIQQVLREGAARRIEKRGLLPKEVEEAVIRTIQAS